MDLQNIISDKHKSLLRGIYIGECMRIISDSMHKLEGDHIPGLLMSVGFEMASDTVAWPFIDKTLWSNIL